MTPHENANQMYESVAKKRYKHIKSTSKLKKVIQPLAESSTHQFLKPPWTILQIKPLFLSASSSLASLACASSTSAGVTEVAVVVVNVVVTVGIPQLSFVLTLLVPGDFATLMYRGGMFFHPPLKNDFLLQKRVIFHLDIKLGIILALF